jgi:hypothetical protein
METGLVQIQSVILREIDQAQGTQSQYRDRVFDAVVRFGDGSPDIFPTKK